MFRKLILYFFNFFLSCSFSFTLISCFIFLFFFCSDPFFFISPFTHFLSHYPSSCCEQPWWPPFYPCFSLPCHSFILQYLFHLFLVFPCPCFSTCSPFPSSSTYSIHSSRAKRDDNFTCFSVHGSQTNRDDNSNCFSVHGNRTNTCCSIHCWTNRDDDQSRKLAMEQQKRTHDSEYTRIGTQHIHAYSTVASCGRAANRFSRQSEALSQQIHAC